MWADHRDHRTTIWDVMDKNLPSLFTLRPARASYGIVYSESIRWALPFSQDVQETSRVVFGSGFAEEGHYEGAEVRAGVLAKAIWPPLSQSNNDYLHSLSTLHSSFHPRTAHDTESVKVPVSKCLRSELFSEDATSAYSRLTLGPLRLTHARNLLFDRLTKTGRCALSTHVSRDHRLF